MNSPIKKQTFEQLTKEYLERMQREMEKFYRKFGHLPRYPEQEMDPNSAQFWANPKIQKFDCLGALYYSLQLELEQ